MYHKVRITVASLAIILTCVLGSSGTLSYFTDTDVKTNSFVVGHASTELVIYDDVADGEKRVFDADNYLPLEDGARVPFYLQASNNGNIPVYQRFRVVIPTVLVGAVMLNLPNMNSCVVEVSAEHKCANSDYIVKYEDSVNNGEYAEYYIMSKHAVGVNDKTAEWPTEELVFGNVPEANSSVYVCNENENNCTFGISIYSDVVQTTGFTDVEDAFASLGETYLFNIN